MRFSGAAAIRRLVKNRVLPGRNVNGTVKEKRVAASEILKG
jgi:hypothetical protein